MEWEAAMTTHRGGNIFIQWRHPVGDTCISKRSHQ